MDKPTNNGLSESERKLLGVFARYGAEGRAITIESLAATAAVDAQSQEFRAALTDLERRGFIRRAGRDPIPGAPLAFRLVRTLDREDRIELPPAPSARLRASPNQRSPIGEADREDEASRSVEPAPETNR